MKKQKQQLNEGILDGLLTKFVRILLSPAESRLLAQVASEDADTQRIVRKANKIMQDFKKEIANDPDIQQFLKDYDKRYNNGPIRYK